MTSNSADTPTKDHSVPEYDKELALYHEAFAPELCRAVGDVPIACDARVLDVPCGDGFYAKLLAERVSVPDAIVGADALSAYLQRGRKTVAEADVDERVTFVKANAYRLPFGDHEFDAVWCAQSFISLDSPVKALTEFRRVLKPSGTIAVLESDEFHHLVLPWPGDFELRLQAAYQAASRVEYGSASKTYVSRRMRRWLRQAGFTFVSRKTYTADRQYPWNTATRQYLEVYLRGLRNFIGKFLSEADRRTFDRLTQPDSPRYLLDRADTDMTCLFTVWQGTTEQTKG